MRVLNQLRIAHEQTITAIGGHDSVLSVVGLFADQLGAHGKKSSCRG